MSSLLINNAVHTQTETAARIDLAAAHRLCAREAYPEALQNHMSIYLSEAPGRMLVTPGEVHWSTIRARDILLMDGAGTVLAGAGEPNGGTYVIHWPIHLARPDLRCLIHIHGTYSTALFMRRDALLETRASQAAMQVDGEIAYFDAYDGALFDRADGERMAQTLGDKRILVLRNHGIVVGGETMGDTFNRLYLFERACQLQLLAQQNGAELNLIPEQVVRRTRLELDRIERERKSAGLEPNPSWPGWKALLDAREPDYATC
jgi:ribulose-5-phosphate 4-epimerase/fuculose-1-phosphate aldolase